MAGIKHPVDGELFLFIHGKIAEIKRQLLQKDGSPLDPMLVAGALQAISEGKFGDDLPPVIPQKSPLVYGLFLPPKQQLKIAGRWNREYGWGFPDTAFDKLAGMIPKISKDDKRIIVVVLEILLDSRSLTFLSALRCIQNNIKLSDRAAEFLSQAANGLVNLREGLVHNRGLRWAVVDLKANEYNGLEKIKMPVSKMPHASLLWLGAFSPVWLKSLCNGTPWPSTLWVYGYKIKPATEEMVENTEPEGWFPCSFYFGTSCPEGSETKIFYLSTYLHYDHHQWSYVPEIEMYSDLVVS